MPSFFLRHNLYECAEQLKIPHNFNKKSKCAGPEGLEGFLKRNTNISVRKPNSTSIKRIEAFNKEEVEFYKNLEEIMMKNIYEPHQIFNMDETGESTVQEPGKFLAKTVQKRVGTVTSWERGKTVTAVCVMNAARVYVPSMFIYPRQHHSAINVFFFFNKTNLTILKRYREFFLKWRQFLLVPLPKKDKARNFSSECDS